ncbi:hypothetical protein AAA799B03_00767 [Marine Group I thaumarchaeote SCGC AAA799-B03]|uniref:Uncharacterized protein n=1 Tax=Marine Group I thaumarchaeote SCGC AAA799-B03 TaxID=1502289 RepID=A0A087S7G3_9ARCH|nr:hypothetical protein AAA799B03_00767 [Marine Group I thaumarchaeote SCGC AAA799-B03]
MSSIVFLGLSVITFAISYGLAFWFMPIIFGSVFSNIIPTQVTDNSTWLNMYKTNHDLVKYLTPLIPTLAITIFVLKIMLSASSRGRD